MCRLDREVRVRSILPDDLAALRTASISAVSKRSPVSRSDRGDRDPWTPRYTDYAR